MEDQEQHQSCFSCSGHEKPLKLGRKLRTHYFLFIHQPASKAERRASIKHGEMQPKHSRNQQLQEAPSSVFSWSPGKAAERACHIKHHRETRSFCSNIKKTGKWKQNAAKQGRNENTENALTACLFSVMEQTTPLTAGKRGASNASGFPYPLLHQLLHYQREEIRPPSERLVFKVSCSTEVNMQVAGVPGCRLK